MRKVARELYVPSAKRGIAYAEAAIEVVPGVTLSSREPLPSSAAGRCRSRRFVLDVAPRHGYSTAVLAELAKAVIGLERRCRSVRVASDTLIARRRECTLAQGGLAEGYGAKAPL